MSKNTNKGEYKFYKTSGNGVSCSLTNDKGFFKLIAVVHPSTESQILKDQVRSALDRLNAVLIKEDLCGTVIKQTIFVRDLNDGPEIQSIMREYYGTDLPVNTYVPQTPCEEELKFILEAYAVRKDGEVIIRRTSENAVVIEYSNNLKFTMVGNIVPDNARESLSYPRSWRGFEIMRDRLKANGFAMSDLLRTWLYQGHIVLEEGDTQRYKELNRARSDFFKGTEFIKELLPPIEHGVIYPASTGIGADNMDVTMSCIAIKTDRKDVTAVPLENPVQTPAFDYGCEYSPKSPKFSRAMAFSYDNTCTVFISGTASITESETVFKGDPEGQVNQTLDNIAELYTEYNLSRHGIKGFSGDLSDLMLARVYVKRPEYYEVIRRVVEKRLGATPVVYTYADVCRDDLLIEIEGIAGCRPHQI